MALRDIQMRPEADDDFGLLQARFRKPITDAIERLKHQADVPTRHRHQMEDEYSHYWQVEVGAHRIYYQFTETTVTVWAIAFKGSKEASEVLKPRGL